jgi:hypothetical protein
MLDRTHLLLPAFQLSKLLNCLASEIFIVN